MPQYPLRIDVRQNDPNSTAAQEAIEFIEHLSKPLGYNTAEIPMAGSGATGGHVGTGAHVATHTTRRVKSASAAGRQAHGLGLVPTGARFISPRRNLDGPASSRRPGSDAHMDSNGGGGNGGGGGGQRLEVTGGKQTYNEAAFNSGDNHYSMGSWTQQGLIEGTKKVRPLSAGGIVGGSKMKPGGATLVGGHKPPRPMSANATTTRGSSGTGAGGNAARVAASLREMRRTRGGSQGERAVHHRFDDADADGDVEEDPGDDGDDDDEEENFFFGAAKTGAAAVGGPLDDQIRALQVTLRKGGATSGSHRGGGGRSTAVTAVPVGGTLDEQIRGMQESMRRDVSGGGRPTNSATSQRGYSESPHRGSGGEDGTKPGRNETVKALTKFDESLHKLSVKDRVHKYTRAVYSNAVDFPAKVKVVKESVIAIKPTTIGTMEVMGNDDDSEKEADRKAGKLVNSISHYESDYKSSAPTLLLRERVKMISAAQNRQRSNAVAANGVVGAGGTGGNGSMRARRLSGSGNNAIIRGEPSSSRALVSTGGTRSHSGKRQSKSQSAHALLEGLQKLNPATLF